MNGFFGGNITMDENYFIFHDKNLLKRIFSDSPSQIRNQLTQLIHA